MTTVRVTQINSGALVVYRLDGRTPSPRECEDAGEDAGFYEPKQERNDDPQGPHNSIVVTEGFSGQLCDHEWGMTGHYGRNPFGSFWRCKKCNVLCATVQKKRGKTIEYTYGEWGLRKYIWDRWMQRGPVPNSLAVQEHHK